MAQEEAMVGADEGTVWDAQHGPPSALHWCCSGSLKPAVKTPSMVCKDRGDEKSLLVVEQLD